MNEATLESYRTIKERIEDQSINNSELIFHGLTLAILNCQDETGETLLHHACRVGNKQAVAYLLSEYEIDIELELKAEGENDGILDATPLHYACFYEHFDIVKLLLRYGANFKALCGNQLTPLQHAIQENHPQVIDCFTPYSAVELGDHNLLKFSLQQPGIGINIRTNKNNDINKYLSIEEAAQHRCGWTALHLAVYFNDLKSVQLLLSHPSIEICPDDELGLTTFFYAVKFQREEIIKLFLKNKDINFLANFDIKEENTVYHLTVKNQNTKILSLIMEYDLSSYTVDELQGQNPWHVTNVFDQYINHVDVHKKTPFHYACQLGDPESARILLQHPKIEINQIDNCGLTPIVYAIRSQAVEILQMIRRHVHANKKIMGSGYKKALAKLTNNLIHSQRFSDDPFFEYYAEAIAAPGVTHKMEAQEEDESEGLTYLQEAVNTGNCHVIFEVLQFADLDLQLRDDQFGLRSIT